MAVNPLTANSKLVVYNNEVDLAAKGASQVYQGATIADVVTASGAGGATVVTTLPDADASKAGKKVYFNGEEWIYATTEWLEALGIDGLVSEGYLLPVNTAFNPRRVTDLGGGFLTVTGQYPTPSGNGYGDVFIRTTPLGYATEEVPNITYDFRFLGLGIGNVAAAYNDRQSTVIYGQKITGAVSGALYIPFAITKFAGAETLSWLRDQGTRSAFSVSAPGAGPIQIQCDASVINDFFEQLPTTTVTATLQVTGFTGGAAANASIAQAKGYTVVQ